MSIQLQNEVKALAIRIAELEKQVAELTQMATKPTAPMKKAS